MTRQQQRIHLQTLAQSEEGYVALKGMYTDRCLPLGHCAPSAMDANEMILALLDREFSKAPPVIPPSAAAERISAAIADCLKRCRASSAPLAMLGKFTAELQANPLWTDRDLAAIETGVRRGLNTCPP